MIDFQNLAQIQMNNQIFIEELENEEMKKLLNTLVEDICPPESQLNLQSWS